MPDLKKASICGFGGRRGLRFWAKVDLGRPSGEDEGGMGFPASSLEVSVLPLLSVASVDVATKAPQAPGAKRRAENFENVPF